MRRSRPEAKGILFLLLGTACPGEPDRDPASTVTSQALSARRQPQEPTGEITEVSVPTIPHGILCGDHAVADVVVNFDVRSQKQIPVTVEAEMLLDGISLGVKRVATESSKKVAVLEGYRMDCFERDNRCFLVQPPKQERRLSARATLTFGDPAVVVRGTFEDGFVNCVKGTAVADARIKLPPKIDCPGSGKIIGSVTYIVFPEDQEKVKELEIRIEADNIIDGRKTVAIEFIPAHKLKMDGKFHEESIEAEAKCFDFKDASGKPFCSLRVKDVSLQVDASDFLTIGTLMGKGGPNDKIGQSFSEKKRTRCQPKRGDGGSGGAGGSGGSGGSGGPDGGGGSGGGSGGGGSGGGGSGGGSGGSDAGGVESGGSGGSNGGGGSGGGSGAGGGGGGGGGGASGGGGQDFARVVG